VSAIIVDDYKGAFDMTRHLIDLGHRAIAFIQGDPRHSPSQRREQGYRAAMAGAQLTIAEEWIAPGLFTYRSGLAAARQLLAAERRPTAIFASNDDMAAAVIAVAHGMDLDVPGDLSIAGFDDAAIAATIWPELTTVRQPIAVMAARAVTLLNEQIRAAQRRAAQGIARTRNAHPGAARLDRACTIATFLTISPGAIMTLFGAIEAGGTKFVCGIGSAERGSRATAVIPTRTPDETFTAVAAFFASHRALRPFSPAISIRLAMPPIWLRSSCRLPVPKHLACKTATCWQRRPPRAISAKGDV
jgi:hypothetical protein